MILIEVTAAVDSSGTLQTFYMSDEGYATLPTDTPANTFFENRVQDPGTIGLHAFSNGRTGGASKLEVGEIRLANGDGSLDNWVNYSFDGRSVTIRSGTAGSAYPAGFTTVFKGTLEGVEATYNEIRLRVRDKQWVLEKQLLTTVYAGTNSGSTGLEGTTSDIAGKVKPRFFGVVYNVAPPQANSSTLIYETGVCQSIDNVYDKGAALTKGADYTSLSDMQTNAPAAGSFRAWPAGGYFRLGSKPAGQLTFDGTAGAAASDRTVASILNSLALLAGLTSGEISSTDVSALNTANSNVVGIWVDDSSSAKTVMDKIAESIGVWYGFDQSGVLRMGQLTAPTGTPVVTLQDYDIGSDIERKTPKESSLPNWRAVIKHSFNWTVQSSDIAGSVTAARMSYLSQQTREAVAEDATIKTQWLLSDPVEFETYLTNSTDAGTEATRRLNIYKVRRDFYEVKVDLSILTANNLKFLDVIGLQLPRFNMTSGKSFRLIGMSLNLKTNRVTLTLWG